MQKQIIVPIATALVAQTAQALTTQHFLNQAPNALGQISASPLELAQEADEGQECRDEVARKKTNKLKRCNKKNKDDPVALQACIEEVNKWEQAKLIKCLPCEQQVMIKFQKRYDNCSTNSENPEKCRKKAENWRDKKIRQCNPAPVTCESIAKAEYEKERLDCNEIQDPEERNQCFANAEVALKEAIEICACKEEADAKMQQEFEACNEIADTDDRNDCIENNQQYLEELYEQCEESDNPEPTCYDNAEAHLDERLGACYAKAENADVEACVREAELDHADWITECKIADCQKEVHREHEQLFKNCHELEDPNEKEQCIAFTQRSSNAQMEMCYPTCKDNAWRQYQHNMHDCGPDKPECHADAERKLDEMNQECEAAECKREVAESEWWRYDECEKIEDREEAHKCEIGVDKTIAEIVQRECYPQPPTCYDLAEAYLNKALEVCRENNDPTEPHCEERARAKHASMVEECDQQECKREVTAGNWWRYDECEGIEDREEAHKCEIGVDKTIAEIVQRECYPQPTCYDLAEAYINERLKVCRDNTDQNEIAHCEEQARSKHAKMVEECDQQECKREVSAGAWWMYDECENYENPNEAQNCEQRVDKAIAELVQKECYPQPTCLEQAEAFYDEQKKECRASVTNDDGTYEACMEVVEVRYSEMLAQCEMRECFVDAEAFYDDVKERCYASSDDPEEQEECLGHFYSIQNFMLERCGLYQCYHNAYAQHASLFKACEELHAGDENEYNICMEETEASLREYQEGCHDQGPTCQEQAQTTYERQREECGSTDDNEVNACIKNAKNDYVEMLEDCRVRDCQKKVYEQVAGELGWCNKITDIVERENCFKDNENYVEKMTKECQQPPAVR